MGRESVGVSVQASFKRKKRGTGFGMFCLLVGVISIAGCQDYNVPIAPVNTGISAGGTIMISPAGIVFVDVGRTRQMSVSVANDSANQGVNWSLSGPGAL